MGRQCKTIFIQILNINILFTIHEKDINNTEKVGKTSNDFRCFHNYLISLDFFLSWVGCDLRTLTKQALFVE